MLFPASSQCPEGRLVAEQIPRDGDLGHLKRDIATGRSELLPLWQHRAAAELTSSPQRRAAHELNPRPDNFVLTRGVVAFPLSCPRSYQSKDPRTSPPAEGGARLGERAAYCRCCLACNANLRACTIRAAFSRVASPCIPLCCSASATSSAFVSGTESKMECRRWGTYPSSRPAKATSSRPTKAPS